MNTGLFLSLSQKRIFWKIRAGLLRAHFMIEKWVYSVRLSIKEERSDIETFRQLLVISQKTFFVAAGLALICVFVDPYLYAFYQQIKTFVPGINTQNDSDYVTFLAVVSSITGIFIGLYYAGISAIGGAIYATVPSNVRNLLMYERGGNVYMSFLACLTFFCLILIALRLSGLPKLYTAIPFVTIFTGVGIIAFAKLGLRMFYFFDPTKLSGYLFEQLRQQLITVKAGGYRWQEDSFQHHAHRKSAEILDTLDTLSDLSARKTHLRGASFIQLAENLLGFLIRYEPEKRYIPTDSYWYEKRYQHRDWYQTEDSSVAIAHQTGRLLHPKVTTDKEWIERRIIPIIMKCIKANLLQKRYTDVNALFKFLNIYVEELTKEGSVKKALNFTEEISSIVMEQFIEKSKCRITKVEELEKLAVAEQLASLPTSIAVEYRKFLEKFDKQDIEQRLASIKWSKNKNIYYNGFPIYCLDRLEWFNPRLEFERKTEGKDISPLWYKTELVCQVEADQMSINTKALIETSAKFFKSLIEKALSYKHPWLAASIMRQRMGILA